MIPTSLSTETKFLVEIIAVSMMPIGFGLLMLHRIKLDRSIATTKFIQIVSIIFVIPMLIIFGIEKILNPETLGTLTGTVIGYLLSGIGSNEKKKSKHKEKRQDKNPSVSTI